MFYYKVFVEDYIEDNSSKTKIFGCIQGYLYDIFQIVVYKCQSLSQDILYYLIKDERLQCKKTKLCFAM